MTETIVMTIFETKRRYYKPSSSLHGLWPRSFAVQQVPHLFHTRSDVDQRQIAFGDPQNAPLFFFFVCDDLGWCRTGKVDEVNVICHSNVRKDVDKVSSSRDFEGFFCGDDIGQVILQSFGSGSLFCVVGHCD